ncbi:replication factor C subunit 3-like isoform X2 [Tasmannia lanceolata]|uniref:replication factor C subunit 3-like isoform X2 n=1 Tax=Tasmannia lanceolata TaxID=3420 RepID=UPI004063E15A
MLTMENSSRYNRDSQLRSSFKQRRSGYEPSDTETDWQESPWHDDVPKILSGPVRNISPLSRNERLSDSEENVAPAQLLEAPRLTEKSTFNRRCVSAPKFREREKDQQIRSGSTERKERRSPSQLVRNLNQKPRESSYSNPSNNINKMATNANLLKGPLADAFAMESIDSVSPGDIFFSRDCTALQKNVVAKKSGFESSFNPNIKVVSERNSSQQQSRGVGTFDKNAQVSISTILSRTNTSSSSAISKQSIGKSSTMSSKTSFSSGNMSGSFRKFTANRQKSQTDMWFACVRRGPCRTSKSPETREIDEASFIEKAFVVESLRQFWADKHRPSSLSGFICHKQQAQHLKQLISHNNCPHILFKGPSGSGKKALTMALLREIYGAPAWKISHDLRYFQVQEARPMEVIIPLASSPHHVELNLRTESKNGRYALMAIVKEITSSFASTPEVSEANFKPDYKVIVLYEVDKLAENVQHLIKWVMDCYTDACKIILCCEDDTELLESVKSRCKLITVDAPVIHGIMEVLIQIARKENFDLPMSFAAKIATKSKQNLRKAIMALEACKAHNYPFVDEQSIPLGWEEVLVELSEEILADPSPKRLFFARGKLQKLLMEFVDPKLILQKLVEQFLKGVEASLKRELYYWHAYYDKRLPVGTGALLKLEEFVAKFLSIYRKSFGGRRYQ